ncbi:hypothetical protein AMTRI_Chr08g163830 [Amborella trichopoda]
MVMGPFLQPTLNTSCAAILHLVNGSPTYVNATFGWVNVKDIAEAHILAYEVPLASECHFRWMFLLMSLLKRIDTMKKKKKKYYY